MKRMRRRATALVLVLAMMLSCGINVFAAAERHNIEYELAYEDAEVDLADLLKEELAYEFDWNSDVELEDWYFWTDDSDEEYYDEDLDYGKINYYDEYVIDLNSDGEDKLHTEKELYENCIYYEVEDTDGYDYYGKIEIIIVDQVVSGSNLDENLVYDVDYDDVLYLGRLVALDLEYLLNDDLDYVDFTVDSDSDDCGDLYYGNDPFDHTDLYYYNPAASSGEADIEEIVFESNDEGGVFYLTYTAYDDDGYDLDGTITINCGTTLVVEVDIDSDEVYEFALIDFDNAVAEWDDDYVLNYITNVELDNNRDGELYDTSGKAVSFRTKYYAESAGDALIEEIIYEPANSASDVIINFTANVQRGNREAEEVSGVLKITIPDITVKAGVGDTVEIDWEVFQEYLENILNSTKYDVAYVTISGAPRSAADGYLVTDGDELTTRGDKTFHMDPTGTQYDLEDLQYQAGSKKGSHKATFKVYYDASATSTPNYKATAEGTIRFRIIDSADSLPDGAKYTIDSVAVRSPLTNSLLDAIPHNDFYAEVAVTNVSSNSTDLLLLAVYAENGEMIDLSFLYANPQVGQTVTFGTLVDNDDGRAYRIKAFMWSSLVNPVPLAEAKAFPEELPDLSGDVVLGYKIIPGMLNGQLMNALMPDATAASMSVASLDGVKWDQAAFAVPEFFLHRTNELGQSTLTSLKTSAEYRACGIYAGLVSKYTYKTGTITLDNGTELTEAEAGFTLYDSRFAANASALEMLDKNEPYIFYAPEGKAVYGVHISGEALEALYVKLGGTLPEAVIPDITIEAGLEQLVGMDVDLFQEYLDEELGSAQYDVVFVTISDAPCSSAEGYLAISGENLTTRGDKSFYVNPEIDEYDLNDLQYQAGSRTGDYDAVFTLYYQHGADGTVDTIEGVIRFEVRNSTSISTTTPLKASQVMSFAYELAAIRNLGGNDNEYIKFISLPINGKLYYDFGTATQKDVVIGEEYHLTEGDGNLQLSRVTYVPSYSASKVMKYDTIAVKCFDKMDIGVKGSINIAIQHAQYSAQFTDVKDAKYADSVDFVYNREIAAGMTATTFGLTEKVTRGQFITFLYRAAGAPAVAGMVNSFTDVKSSDYYYNAVMWADKYNLIADRSTDTTFDPTSPVTHQEMLTFMYYYDVSYLGHYASLGSASYVYDYANVDTWAQLPVKWAVGKGIIDYGNLLPKEAGTRATVALWLHRMLTL